MPTRLIEDKVWWDKRRKLNGICSDISEASSAHQNVLLLAHFETTLAEIEAELFRRSIQIQRLASIEFLTLCSSPVPTLWSGLARSFPAPRHTSNDWGATKFSQTGQSVFPLNIIVAEHYPLRSRDEQLVDAAAGIACEAQLTFHLSLDDPLLINFGVRSVQDFGRRLGIDEETFLSNAMITRSIKQAQEKIEKQLPRDLPATSIEDWFKHNLPTK
jgi:preprotein translocase subunit SecA